MNEQELIEQYRKQVESSSAKAPEGLWDDIANQLDIDEVWNGVSNQLDIDDVWEGISAELDSEKRSPSIWIYTAWAASVALLVTFGVAAYWFSVKSPVVSPASISSVEIVERVQPATPTTGSSTATPDSDNSTDTESSKHIAHSNSQNTSKDITRSVSNDEVKTQSDLGVTPTAVADDLKRDNISVSKINPRTANVSANSVVSAELNLGSQLAYAPIADPVEVESPRRHRTLSVGATSAIKNTWLFGTETMEGLNRNSLTKSDVKIYPDFGLNVKYGFSQRWSAETSVFFKSRTGQSYKEYIYGRYSDKDIALYYTQIELFAKYSSTKRWVRSNAFGFTTSLGLFYSNLSSASETIAGESKSVGYRYSSNDYGFVLGQDVEVMLTNRIVLSPGLRLKWGLPNIYAGEENIPSSLKRTHNRSLEFRFTVYYNIFR